LPLKIGINLACQLPNILNNTRHLSGLILNAFMDNLINLGFFFFYNLGNLLLMDHLGLAAQNIVLTLLFLVFQLFCNKAKKTLDLVAHLAEMLNIDMLTLADFLASLFNSAKLGPLLQNVTFLQTQLSFEGLTLLLNHVSLASS